jgi:hypothetical protein
VKALHIATSLRIVAKDKHMPKIPLDQARDIIQRLAATKNWGARGSATVDDLEARTGVPISELAKLTTEWLTKG